MLKSLYNKFFKKDKEMQVFKINEEQDKDFEKEELELEIKTNKNKNLIIRNYDRKIVKDIKIFENNICFNTFPCLHGVLLIFTNNKYEETTMNILTIYEIWKELSFDISLNFLKHCKNELQLYNDKEGHFDLFEKNFTVKKINNTYNLNHYNNDSDFYL
jgi:hypothetical protein